MSWRRPSPGRKDRSWRWFGSCQTQKNERKKREKKKEKKDKKSNGETYLGEGNLQVVKAEVGDGLDHTRHSKMTRKRKKKKEQR